MSGQLSESTPATNICRRPADRRALAESSSIVKSEHLDAMIARREGSDSASYVRLHHRDLDPLCRCHPPDFSDIVPTVGCCPIEFDAGYIAATNKPTDGSAGHAESKSSS